MSAPLLTSHSSGSWPGLTCRSGLCWNDWPRVAWGYNPQPGRPVHGNGTNRSSPPPAAQPIILLAINHDYWNCNWKQLFSLKRVRWTSFSGCPMARKGVKVQMESKSHAHMCTRTYTHTSHCDVGVLCSLQLTSSGWLNDWTWLLSQQGLVTARSLWWLTVLYETTPCYV